MFIRVFLIAALTGLWGCSGESGSSKEKAWTPPAAGTLVAADSIALQNDFAGYFSVYLRVAEGNNPGPKSAFRYNLEAHYGAAEALGVIAMPYGGERLRPILRREDSLTMLLGFRPSDVPGIEDTTFHPYYKIGASRISIKLIPLASYSFEER